MRDGAILGLYYRDSEHPLHETFSSGNTGSHALKSGLRVQSSAMPPSYKKNAPAIGPKSWWPYLVGVMVAIAAIYGARQHGILLR